MYATIRRARMCYTEKCRQIIKFEGPAPVCVQIDMLVRIGEWMDKLTDSASISLAALWFLIWGPMLGYLGPSPDASSNRRHITPYLPAWCGPLVYFLEVLRRLCRSTKSNNFRNGLQIAFRGQYAYGRTAFVAFLQLSLARGKVRAWKRCWWTPWAKPFFHSLSSKDFL